MATAEQAGGDIWQLMPKVIKSIGVIKKDRTNDGKSYKFRGIDEVLSALNPALVEHGVTPSIRVLKHKLEVARSVENAPARGGGTYEKEKFTVHATLKLAVRFTAPDGSFVENIAAGEAMDYQDDKATNKAHAAAFKYAVLLGLCIPTKDVIDDGDTKSPLHGQDDQAQRPQGGQRQNSRRQNDRRQQNQRPPANQQRSGPKAEPPNGAAKTFPHQADTADAAVAEAQRMKQDHGAKKSESELKAEAEIDKAPDQDRLLALKRSIRDERRPFTPDIIKRLDLRIDRRIAEFRGIHRN